MAFDPAWGVELPVLPGEERVTELAPSPAADAEIDEFLKVANPSHSAKPGWDAIQAWGGAGVTDDPGLARAYAHMRSLRLADGPDEVHNRAIARMEIARHGNFTPAKH